MSDLPSQQSNELEEDPLDSDPVWEKYRSSIIGDPIWLRTYPSLSVLSDRAQTLIVRAIVEEYDTKRDVVVLNLNSYTVASFAERLLEALKSGLQAMDAQRENILSAPGGKKDAVAQMNEISTLADSCKKLLSRLLIEE